jgi:subtilase family serine protease
MEGQQKSMPLAFSMMPSLVMIIAMVILHLSSLWGQLRVSAIVFTLMTSPRCSKKKVSINVQQGNNMFRHYFKPSRAGGQSWTPPALAAHYNFPAGINGQGKKVAVIELGGGYVQADLDKYFSGMGLTVKPVVFHSIAGGQNAPGDPNGADGEVMLDLCVIGGMASGAELHCYMSPNTNGGFLAAIQQAITDKMDAISISWGGPEDSWDSATLTAFNNAFLAAANAGITVTAAAGDNGSGDGESGDHVDFPASSPYVLACGGTSVSGTTEVVWNDGGATGGGVSSVFAIPTYQKSANVPGSTHRGVPDVAGNADPQTGWIIVVDGQTMVIGGTSAVAPMWAAIAVVLSQSLGRNVGFMHNTLYANTSWARDVLVGNNGTYQARPGYDCCTGLGVPDVTKLLALFGAPVTPTPPPIVPPPPPVVLPVPIPVGTLKQQIDAVFAKLIAANATRPFYVQVLRISQQLLDQYLTQHPLSNSNITTTELPVVIDAIFKSLEAARPQWAWVLAIANQLIDQSIATGG